MKPGQAGSWLEHPASSTVPRTKAMEIFILFRLRPQGWAYRIEPHLGLRAMLLSARSLIPCRSQKLVCAAQARSRADPFHTCAQQSQEA